MVPNYQFACLSPSGPLDAEGRNAALLGPLTLGIEVTDEALASRCGLGNIDPQHDPRACADVPAAIEMSVAYPLPPPGARLVTIRPDLDAFGAMAILALRAAGQALTSGMLARVDAAGRADRFDAGAWPGPRPLPTSVDDMDVPAGGDISALAAACSDDAVAVPARVAVVAEWLRDGLAPASYACAARLRVTALIAALRNGDVEISSPAERLAVVVSKNPGALRLGYFKAPVVIACNPAHRFAAGAGETAPGVRYTVAQFTAGHADLNAVADDLNRLEPGWGGSATIKGSPQARPSRLDLRTVSDIVRRHVGEPAPAVLFPAPGVPLSNGRGRS